MRRPAVPFLIALLAVALAAWQRARRRAAAQLAAPEGLAVRVASPPRALSAAPRLLEAPQPPEPDAMETSATETPVGADDPADRPHPQVERENRWRFARSGPRFVSVAWSTVIDPPPAAATELRIRFALATGGMRLDRIDARETGSQVFVTVLAWWEPPPPGTPSDTEDHEATVSLEQPLGDRALVHAPHDHPHA